jgi:hypothetical protein
MALERQDMRDELVAVIAAGRELSPEHDYHLADVYLDHIHRYFGRQRKPLRWFEDPKRLRTLLAAAGIALAALLFSFFLLAAAHGGDRFDRGYVGPRWYLHDPDSGRLPNWYIPAPGPQFPQSGPGT